MSRIIFLVCCLVFVHGIGVSQDIKFNVTEETTMTVSGTSTLHDWTSQVNMVTGFIEMDNEIVSRNKVKKGDEIEAVNIVVPVKSIISPRGATMDKKTYNALKSEEFPEITFDLKNNKVASISGDTFVVNSSGNLTIAGKTNQVEFPVKGKLIGADKMSFTGSYKLNMKDYDMEPPSAMFGQIETGEEVEIKFELVVSK